MQQEIQHILSELEDAKRIKILYAVESGSRAWGFASTNSDWDVRFIYVQEPDWYLDLRERKDNIEQMFPNDIDVAGWDLQKALRLFRKSNPPLLEWLRSPIVYIDKQSFSDDLRIAAEQYFNPKSCLYHYFHMAYGNWQAYFKDALVRLKKYLYVLRPLFACHWIMQHNTIPPMEFDELLSNQSMDKGVRAEIEALIQRKKEGEELTVGNRVLEIDAYSTSSIYKIQAFLDAYSFKNEPDWDPLNFIFKKHMNEAWQTTQQV